MTAIFSLRSAEKARLQEARNANEAMTWINLGDSKLQDGNKALIRAHDLLVRSGSPMTTEERKAVSTELIGLRDELVALANSKHLGQGLFGGFAAGNAVAQVAGVWTFTGDTGVVNRRIGEGESVSVNVTAQDVFGFSAGEDVFTILETAAANVASGDPMLIDASMAAVEGAQGRILDGLARLGATGTRVERVLLRNQSEQVTLKGELSEIEDVDLAEAVMEMQMQQVGYQASLAALSNVLQPSLVDFLR
jgi:flagellar hook-associated protein 3 FlgL